MHRLDIEHMFQFTYEKSSEEIKAKAAVKVEALTAKVAERRKRITDMRAAYGITEEIMTDLFRQARSQRNAANTVSYTSNARVQNNATMTEETVTVPAGVVNNLMTEFDMIDGENSQIHDLQLVCRNLLDLPRDQAGSGPLRGHRLTKDELVYLGF